MSGASHSYPYNTSMAWVYLLGAGLMEVGWATGLKMSQGFTRVGWSAFTVGCMALSFWCLSHAMKSIPLGTAYAIWTGIGAVGVAILGMVYFGDPRNALRILCLGLIVLGILGLKLFGSPEPVTSRESVVPSRHV